MVEVTVVLDTVVVVVVTISWHAFMLKMLHAVKKVVREVVPVVVVAVVLLEVKLVVVGVVVVKVDVGINWARGTRSIP